MEITKERDEAGNEIEVWSMDFGCFAALLIVVALLAIASFVCGGHVGRWLRSVDWLFIWSWLF